MCSHVHNVSLQGKTLGEFSKDKFPGEFLGSWKKALEDAKIDKVTKGIFLAPVVSSWYSMCSLAVITLDSPAVDPRSNPGSGKVLMSENLRLYTTYPVVMC